ncbi:sensor histidine kinase [Pseudodesulfovibrio tunisiensis]|uniref:sensor histidine kinase n=1 Tax=Pseudodesulfovibrio tunisiensis TaxID=463192 RepID=UPI001FB4FC73|nr:PAS domain-containing sensor histidine kinase [Pseudodesulfovibrio tunisiensis]
MTIATYRKLRWKLIVITLCFSLIPLLALGYFLHSEFSESYTTKVEDHLRLIVANKRDAVDVFLAERVVQLRNLAGTHTYAEMTDQKYLDSLLDTLLGTSRSIIDLGIIDSSGKQVAYAGPYELKGLNYKEQPWFHQVLLKGLYISNVFMGFRQYPHFIIAVTRREAGRTWILRATIDSHVFSTLVRSLQLGEGGDAYLVNREMQLQTPSRFRGNELTRVDLPLRDVGGDVRVFRCNTPEGERVAGATRLHRTDWVLVVTEDPREELSPLMRSRSIAGLLFGAGVIMIAVGALLTTNSVVRKLVQADREKAAMDAGVLQSSKMASLGKMAAGVAHEINNPLSIIRESAGWIRDLINDGELDGYEALDELQEAVGDIERHVERARQVTHRMLGFARRMEPLQENVDLNHLARETAKFLDNEVLHRNIDVKFDLNDLPEITTDVNQVQQVILNLLENAIDAIGQDGVITVRSATGDQEVRLSVEDTGTGIPKEYLHKVFDPFFTTKSVGEGTGLGLSIIYSTLRKLGGDITVESEFGKGTVFTVHLPVGEAVARHEERVI